ncbi:MAG: FGGY family carbohydrate kinase, partial [Pseudomonadota bacterium]
MTFLGLDLGTSGLRGLLVDEAGAPIGDAVADYAVSTPRTGWSEQDPAAWVSACETVIGALRAAHPQSIAALRGIAVSGHMHGAVLVDAAGAVIRPCLLWNDTRAADQAARLDAEPAFRAISGNIVFPGFTAPKVLWVRENERDAFDRTTKILLPKASRSFSRTHSTLGAVNPGKTILPEIARKAGSASSR